MHVLALLFALIAMLAVAPGDARCAEECEPGAGKGSTTTPDMPGDTFLDRTGTEHPGSKGG